MGHASGSGVSSTFGAPRGDFSPYKSQDKGKETPVKMGEQSARKALYQFARGSMAAAGQKDGKAGNIKRAMMGGVIAGSEAFTDKGVDLSKASGLSLDTNAPTSSADLSNLGDKVKSEAKKAEKKKEEEKQTLWEKLGEQLLTGLVNMGVQAIGKLADYGIDQLTGSMAAASASRADKNAAIGVAGGITPDKCLGNPDCVSFMEGMMGKEGFATWKDSGQTFNDFRESGDNKKMYNLKNRHLRENLGTNGDTMPVTLVKDDEGNWSAPKPEPYKDADGNPLLDNAGNPILPQPQTFGSHNREVRANAKAGVETPPINLGPKTTTSTTTNNSGGLNVYLQEHCADCTVGSESYNQAVSAYNKKYNNK